MNMERERAMHSERYAQSSVVASALLYLLPASVQVQTRRRVSRINSEKSEESTAAAVGGGIPKYHGSDSGPSRASVNGFHSVAAYCIQTGKPL